MKKLLILFALLPGLALAQYTTKSQFDALKASTATLQTKLTSLSLVVAGTTSWSGLSGTAPGVTTFPNNASYATTGQVALKANKTYVDSAQVYFPYDETRYVFNAAGKFTAKGNLTAGTVGSATTIPIITYDSTGRVTSASSVTFSAGSGGGSTTVRSTSVASTATPTPNSTTTDQYILTALATNATFAAPTGSPVDGQALTFRIRDDGTSRTLTFSAIYRALGAALPSVTVPGKLLYITMRYNAGDAVWDVLSVAQQS